MPKLYSLTRLFAQNPIAQITILVVIYLAISILLLNQTQAIPIWGENNRERIIEHYAAYLHGYNAARFGFWQSSGLADESTNQNPAKHPVVYIHGNILMPRLFTFLMFYLGVESILAQTLLFVFVAAIWIPLGYLAFSKLFNPQIAFFSILLMITDYAGTLTHAVNLFRSWHFVLFFFLIWASARLESQTRNIERYFTLGIAIFITVNYELPFAAFCVLISGYVIYLRYHSLKKTFIVLAGPVIFALIVFATQITLYLGGVTQLLAYASTTFAYRIGLMEPSSDLFARYTGRRILFGDTSANPLQTAITFIFDAITYLFNTAGLLVSLFIVLANLFLIFWFVYNKTSTTERGQTLMTWLASLPPFYLMRIEFLIFLIMPTLAFILTSGTLPVTQPSLWLVSTILFLAIKLIVYVMGGFQKSSRFDNSPGNQHLQKLIFFAVATLFLQTYFFSALQNFGWIASNSPPYLAFYEGVLSILALAFIHADRLHLTGPGQLQKNVASFVAVSFGAVLIVALLFPSNLDFYNRNFYPLFVFFVYLAIPIFLSYIHSKLTISFSLLISLFLICWLTAQAQIFRAFPLRADSLVQTLQEDYRGTSFGTTIPFTYLPIWYAIKSDVSLIDINLSPDRPADVPVFAYNRNFAYNDTGQPPQHIYLTREEVLDISAYLLLNQDLLHTLFNGRPEIVNLEGGRYAIITTSPPVAR